MHEGRAVPLDRSDVDTDQIIPSDWLKRVERTGFGKGLFSEWRDERDFVLNDERFAGATILVAGANFGPDPHESTPCGTDGLRLRGGGLASIRRHLPQQLHEDGLVPVQVSEEAATRLRTAVAEDPDLAVTVDVERRVLSAPAAGIEESFPMDDATRERFLEGLDDIGITLRSVGAIDSYEGARPAWMPTT